MNWWNKDKLTWVQIFAIIILAVNHLVGLIGMHTRQGPLFESVAWLNLLLSFVFIVSGFYATQRATLYFTAVAFITGIAVEIVGVATGWPFGNYNYTSVLGYGIMGVPLIIGLNWVLLGLSCGAVAGYFPLSPVIKIALASVLMVVVDVLLEPFAIAHHLWIWKEGTPGLSNFAGWFITALAIQVLYYLLKLKPANYLPLAYLFILLVFLSADKFFH